MKIEMLRLITSSLIILKTAFQKSLIIIDYRVASISSRNQTAKGIIPEIWHQYDNSNIPKSTKRAIPYGRRDLRTDPNYRTHNF